jgi:hypothetical protein
VQVYLHVIVSSYHISVGSFLLFHHKFANYLVTIIISLGFINALVTLKY